MKRVKIAAFLVAIIGLGPSALAHESEKGHDRSVSSTQELPKVSGVIKKIQAESGKVTIKHGDIPNLEMPGMTMVFEMADPAMIRTIAVGDRVLFTVVRERGAFMIQWIEKQ